MRLKNERLYPSATDMGMVSALGIKYSDKLSTTPIRFLSKATLFLERRLVFIKLARHKKAAFNLKDGLSYAPQQKGQRDIKLKGEILLDAVFKVMNLDKQI